MRLHHLAFRSHRFPELVAFYGSVLGLAVVREQPGRAVWFALDRSVLMVEQAAPGEPAIPRGSLELVAWYADTADKEALRARLVRHGVAVEHETAHTLYFRDPEGRRLGVSDYPLPLSA